MQHFIDMKVVMDAATMAAHITFNISTPDNIPPKEIYKQDSSSDDL